MISTNWIWTDHIKLQLIERKIPKESVEMALNNPDKVVHVKENRIIYQKIVRDKLIRVITENNKLITVYLTNKIQKYIEGE